MTALVVILNLVSVILNLFQDPLEKGSRIVIQEMLTCVSMTAWVLLYSELVSVILNLSQDHSEF